jgi:hypothetical protein
MKLLAYALSFMRCHAMYMHADTGPGGLGDVLFATCILGAHILILHGRIRSLNTAAV